MTLDADYLRALLSYDARTGVFKRRHSTRRHKRGSVIGFRTTDGYQAIKIRGKFYKVHRLAWLYIHGRWPLDQIDHINRQKLDNRIENLRECSRQQNMRNTDKYRTNSSGYKNVHWVNGKWRAVVNDGKQRTLGYFRDPQAAAIVAAQAEREVYGEFACQN